MQILLSQIVSASLFRKLRKCFSKFSVLVVEFFPVFSIPGTSRPSSCLAIFFPFLFTLPLISLAFLLLQLLAFDFKQSKKAWKKVNKRPK